MKRIIEVDEKSGLEGLLGREILVFCVNYIYTGTLSAVNESSIELTKPSIVYETGAFDDPKYGDAQRLHTEVWFIQLSAVESFGLSK